MWNGRTAILEIKELVGALSQRCVAVEAKRHGTFCGEWVPYLVLRNFRLHDPAGHIVNPNTQCRLLCQHGHLIKDVMHWSWTRSGDIKVTVLTERITAANRRQIGHFMRMLVFNFPQLLRKGRHDGLVRYHTNAADHRPIQRTLTHAGRLERPHVSVPTLMADRDICTHRELELHMQREVGETPRVVHVHPHPRLARMVCLWAGRRRVAISRQHFKKQLHKKARERGKQLRDRATSKWAGHSAEAASGLELLHWRSIRRVVGLTPWGGAQVLLRLKHHALSTYDPVSAGLHCPHPQCVRAGRVNLRHVFWTCPAAEILRSMFLVRWASVGLQLAHAETAIFSLSLVKIPSNILAATGRSIADCLDEPIDQLGDVVEQIVTQSWRLGAALYFHYVWRWRVAHFDQHNDVSRSYHEAGFAARLRSGHSTIIGAHAMGRDGVAMAKIGRIIGAMLGGSWTGRQDGIAPGAHVYLVFHAGRTCVSSGSGASGTMVVKTHILTGAFQVLYLGGTQHAEKMEGGHKAIHLGLLKGLRECKRNAWHPAHVVGDNKVEIRQFATRTPPRKAALKATYWIARRTADAGGVHGWHAHPRERNRTVHEITKVVMTTQQGMHWHASTDRIGGARWAAVMAFAADDVRFWSTETEKPNPEGFAEGTE